VFLGLGAVKFPTPPSQAAAQICPPAALRLQDDYLVCIVGGRHEYFPAHEQALHDTPAAGLQRVAAGMLGDWPGPAAGIVSRGDPASFFIVGMYTSVPCELGPPGNVTVLGDAIHAMTPTLGRGANLALRDGALLGRQLKAVAAGRTSISQALAAYEAEMLPYSFSVVRESVQTGQQRMAQNPLPQ
jgi:2-polyprenyl-6-methoxyphenol hydroxylase-like FAD-dependent oxidoreductase